jgi:hypothetical protein
VIGRLHDANAPGCRRGMLWAARVRIGGDCGFRDVFLANAACLVQVGGDQQHRGENVLLSSEAKFDANCGRGGPQTRGGLWRREGVNLARVVNYTVGLRRRSLESESGTVNGSKNKNKNKNLNEHEHEPRSTSREKTMS